MKLSDKMRQWEKDSHHPNSDITVGELAIMDNQSVLIFAEEAGSLETRIKELEAELAKMKRDGCYPYPKMGSFVIGSNKHG